jgi:hypothetical protein
VAWGWGEREHPFDSEFEVVGRLELDTYLRRPVLRVADARAVEPAAGIAPAASGPRA